MRAPVSTVRVQGRAGQLESLRTAADDIRAAGSVAALVLEAGAGPELRVEVRLAGA